MKFRVPFIDPELQMVYAMEIEYDEKKGELIFPEELKLHGTYLPGYHLSGFEELYYDPNGHFETNSQAFMFYPTGETIYGKAYVLGFSRHAGECLYADCNLSVEWLENQIAFCDSEESELLREYNM